MAYGGRVKLDFPNGEMFALALREDEAIHLRNLTGQAPATDANLRVYRILLEHFGPPQERVR